VRALFVSPHLDDVAFSCGGTLAALAREGWHCTLLTCFTASVADPRGFALACQTDKGIAPEVDYMALRRREDELAAQRLGAVEVVHLPLPEAPHRGYASAPELFGPVRDDVWRELAPLLPRGHDRVFLPQGKGGHVDHVQVIRAAEAAGLRGSHYADLPYDLDGTDGHPGPVTPDLAAKADACAAYASQLGFQFGGEDRMRARLGAAPERFQPSAAIPSGMVNAPS
jgi:LmbE family N-acetylglucosaminyl deacetylase